MVRWLEIVIVIQNFSNNADTNSSTYYKRCCVTAIWFILLILPVTWSLFALSVTLAKKWRNQSFVLNRCFSQAYQALRTKNNELWKTVRLTSFQKPQFQSVLIFFTFNVLAFKKKRTWLGSGSAHPVLWLPDAYRYPRCIIFISWSVIIFAFLL